MENKDENIEIDLKTFYTILNKFIKEEKVRFRFLDSTNKLDLIQNTYNEVENTIDLEFRDNMEEYIQELKEIIEKTSTK